MQTFAFLKEYQRQVKEGLMLGAGNDPLAHCALGLCGEAGEVADMIKKSQYSRPKPYVWQDMKFELGDVLWYTTALAGQHGLTLVELIEGNVIKLALQHPTASYNADRLYNVDSR